MRLTSTTTDIVIKKIVLDMALIQKLEFMVFANHRVTKSKFDYVRANSPLLLVATHLEDIIGFKLGYIIPDTTTFFSWLGGVHPDYRRRGIAESLLKQQEASIKEKGMDTIYFTTYDKFPAMIQLGKKHHYELVKTEQDDGEIKYWYEKQL